MRADLIITGREQSFLLLFRGKLNVSVSGAGQEMGGCRHGVGAGSPQAVWGRAGGRAAQGLRQKAGDDDAFWAVSQVCPLVILGRSWPAWRCMTQPC